MIGNSEVLKQVQNLVTTHYEGILCSNVIVSAKGVPIVQVSASNLLTNGGSTLTYLPILYVIGVLEEDGLLTLRLITFHGKILASQVTHLVN